MASSMEPTSRWQVVLSSASRALRGRVVSVWESDEGGELRRIAASGFEESLLSAPEELARALRQWQGRVARRRKWVASRIEQGRWCVAPVNTRPPRPHAGTDDRRRPERAVLGLAGACLGMLERQGGAARVPAAVERKLQKTMLELESTVRSEEHTSELQ